MRTPIMIVSPASMSQESKELAKRRHSEPEPSESHIALEFEYDISQTAPIQKGPTSSIFGRTERQGSTTSQDTSLSTFEDLPVPDDRKLAIIRDRNPLGLTLVWEPPSERELDIIFVHGLGGTSHDTWSKNHHPDFFWPHQWLPREPEICRARIMSFGYNADFKSTGARSFANISDFAKDLLQAMRFGNDGGQHLEDFNLGEVPIIFIVHSMGGLVVKKAYVMAQHDAHYKDMASSVCSIMFLGTPHRGSNFAQLLNNILSSVVMLSPKQFIADLRKDSPALASINDDFVNHASKLQIVSFYETLETKVGIGNFGVKKMMIVDKESAILHVKGEIQKPMNANHHEICKYSSQLDPNYTSLRNILKTMVEKFRDSGFPKTKSADKAAKLTQILAVSDRPDDDLGFFRLRWLHGTCHWILKEPAFKRWLSVSSPGPRILWIHAVPACGKSILSSFIINHLEDENKLSCQFFFFRFGDPTKVSIGSFLRSMAFQVAQTEPIYQQKLRALYGDGTSLGKLDPESLWQKLFVGALFKLKLKHVLYWVVDGLDESDTPHKLFDMLARVLLSLTPIRIIVLSRESQHLSNSFARMKTLGTVERLAIQENTTDVRLLVEDRLKEKNWSSKLKKSVLKDIMTRADGNFLWVHLVLEEIIYCHSETEIHDKLKDIPAGMTSLYARMEMMLANISRPEDKVLAKSILTWICCSRRAMKLDELSQALQLDSFLDLRSSIFQACGQFVIVDSKNQALMVHQTARDYLTTRNDIIQNCDTQFSIRVEEGHEMLFSRCMAFLSETDLRSRLESCESNESFLKYAATSWMHHLSLLSTDSPAPIQLLCDFLRGPAVSVWIHALAKLHELKSLVRASQVLISFSEKAGKIDRGGNALRNFQDLEYLNLWAMDFVKLSGRFGHQLQDDPQSIYTQVPQFCPRNSIIYRQFSQDHPFPDLQVMGFSNESWDDCLARIPIGQDRQATMITCAGPYIAVSASSSGLASGTVIIWDSTSFEEVGQLFHNEHLTAIYYNPGSRCFVSCGFQSTKVWALPSCELIHTVPNPERCRVLAITFDPNNNSVIIGSDDKVVRRMELSNPSPGWMIVQTVKDDTTIQGGVVNAPCCMAFDHNGTQIAVGYRGFPLSVWKLNNTKEIRRCRKSRGQRGWMSVDLVSWNPRTGHILGRYNDGVVFKWHPMDSMSHQLRTSEADIASELRCSPDGGTFATCDVSGTIRIWDFQSFSLIYQLSCESPISDFVFSPDCRRFYDLRDSFCNIWEPNALVRRAEADEKASDTTSNPRSETIASVNLQVVAELLVPIMVVAPSPDGLFYSTGNDEGTVELFTKSGERLSMEWTSSNYQMIEYLVWGQDSRHIAVAELGGNVTVKRLCIENARGSHPAVTASTLFTSDIVGTSCIKQILLNDCSTILLIALSESAQAWCLESGKCVSSLMYTTTESSCKWINSPTNPNQLLRFYSAGLETFQWPTLSLLTSFELQHIHRPALQHQQKDLSKEAGHIESIESIIVSYDRSLILVTALETVANRVTEKFMIINVASIEHADGNRNSTLGYARLPDIIGRGVQTTLGILSNDKLVFLDKRNRIRTYNIDRSNGDSTTVEYCLPRDWVNADCLQIACLMADGTFLCPRNGEVAIVKSNTIDSAW